MGAGLKHIPAKAVSNDVTLRKKGKAKKKGNLEDGIKSQDKINKPECAPKHSCAHMVAHNRLCPSHNQTA